MTDHDEVAAALLALAAKIEPTDPARAARLKKAATIHAPRQGSADT